MRDTLVKAWPIVVALGVAGGMWQWGYTVGDGKSDQLVDLLKEQNRALGEESRRSSAENESLKIQLQRSTDTPTLSGEINPSTTEEYVQPSPSGSTDIQVSAQSTEELYEGDLLITLIATDFTGSPLRHQAHFTLGSPHEESKTFSAVDPGFFVTYAGYHVRLVSTGSISAKFLVSKAP